jgi:DNA-binding NtrC family response regulator
VAAKVLIVDDEPDLAETCARLLRSAGFDCVTAATGTDAMALIDREAPRLVVTDLRLPRADGLQVTRHAQRHSPPVPVVLITAYASADARRKAAEAGATGFLPKPFGTGDLLEAIRRGLERPAA